MSYVGKMSDLIELYLAEFKRDELYTPFGIHLTKAKELLTDFAQWLEDDVQDTETVDGLSADVILVNDAANLTGFGDSIIENLDMPSQEELDKLGKLKVQQLLHRLRVDSALSFLSALNKQEDSDIG